MHQQNPQYEFDGDLVLEYFVPTNQAAVTSNPPVHVILESALDRRSLDLGVLRRVMNDCACK